MHGHNECKYYNHSQFQNGSRTHYGPDDNDDFYSADDNDDINDDGHDDFFDDVCLDDVYSADDNDDVNHVCYDDHFYPTDDHDNVYPTNEKLFHNCICKWHWRYNLPRGYIIRQFRQ